MTPFVFRQAAHDRYSAFVDDDSRGPVLDALDEVLDALSGNLSSQGGRTSERRADDQGTIRTIRTTRLGVGDWFLIWIVRPGPDGTDRIEVVWFDQP